MESIVTNKIRSYLVLYIYIDAYDVVILTDCVSD